jgi:hypothetical protein
MYLSYQWHYHSDDNPALRQVRIDYVVFLTRDYVTMRLNFASRAEQLEFVRRAIIGRDTGTIVVTGEPGIGRTTFLASSLAWADPERDEVVLMNSSAQAPFTTLPSGLPPSLPEPATTRGPAGKAAGQETGRRFVIAVDDVHLMDYSSLLVLRNLVSRGLALLLVTRPWAGSRPSKPDPSSCLAHDRNAQTITLLPLSVPEVAATLTRAAGELASRTAAEAARAATGGNPSALGALVATTTAAASPRATYPGLEQLAAATWDAWRRLALDRTELLCRLALRCGAQEEIAPIWAVLLLLRGRPDECLAFLESLDVAGQLPLRLAVVRALALALGLGQAAEAGGYLLTAAGGDGKPPEFFLAVRAWVLAVSGRGAGSANTLADLSRKDHATALFVHAAKAVHTGRGGQRAESVFHLRRAIASAEASNDDYLWIRPYLQASLIDALILCGRRKEAVSAARQFHAHEPSSGWEIAASLDALIAKAAGETAIAGRSGHRDVRGLVPADGA